MALGEAGAALDGAASELSELDDRELRWALCHIERLTSRLRSMQARLVAEADRRNLATRDGCASPAAWLTSQLGVSAAEAARRQHEAAAVVASPQVAEALDRGAITPEHARLIGATTAAEPGLDIGQLVADAERLDAGRFADRARRLRRAHQADGGLSEHERQRAARSASVWVRPDDGMVVLRAELDPLAGARVRAALWAEADRLWRAEHDDERGAATDVPVEARTNPQRLADALANIFGRPPTPGLAPETVEVLVTVPLDALTASRPVGDVTAEVVGVGPVPVATARRLACEAGTIPAVLDGRGETLDLGRSRRLASPAQRRALLRRYATCSAPGCATPFAWCQIHHLNPWEAGGRTDWSNLVPLCTRHHHLVHEGGWGITRRHGGDVTLEPPP